MNTSTLTTITLAAALSALGSATLDSRAADVTTRHRPLRAHTLERAKEKLNLTDEQIAQIKSALKSDRNSIKDLLARLREARVGLREAIHAAEATEASVRVAAAKVAAVEADLAVERMKVHGKISPILTEEQRDKFDELRSHPGRFPDRRNGGAVGHEPTDPTI
jgi:Spy/CpxP family protein refolding chaperone